MIRRYFASVLAAALAPLVFIDARNRAHTILNVVDYRTASGRKSTLGGVARSKYQPHQGERECARRRRQMAAAARFQPRPMTSLYASLTPAQQAALA